MEAIKALLKALGITKEVQKKDWPEMDINYEEIYAEELWQAQEHSDILSAEPLGEEPPDVWVIDENKIKEINPILGISNKQSNYNARWIASPRHGTC